METQILNGKLTSTGKFPVKPLYIFMFLWSLLFILYLPALKGGWVSDTNEWLEKIRSANFTNFINDKQSRGSMYQVTQIVTFLLFKVFHDHPWPWHLLFITMQACNCTLVFVIFRNLFDASAVKNGVIIAGGAAILFCICPHVSEVVVWKASYHYLQAMLMMLIIVYWLQRFLTTPKPVYAVMAVGLFGFSTFTHEFFYLTPLFALTLLVYYRLALGCNKRVFKMGMLYFVLPFVILTACHYFLRQAVSGSYSHTLGDEINQPVTGYARKPLLYLFHTIFFGRFLSPGTRQMLYEFAATKTGLAFFYGVLTSIWGYIILRFRKMTAVWKVAVLIFIWLQLSVAVVCPMWFPETLLVNFDRYTYYMLPFIYLLIVMALVNLKIKEWGITIFIVYAFINILLSAHVNKYWGESARIVDKLVHSVPPVDNKIVLLLNVPEYMNGVPMVGPFLHFSFQKMTNLYNQKPVTNTMFDVVSYNMSGPNDGAHVNVYGDSLMHVTLNQWGTWWWYGMWGAFSYENEYYKVNMTDMGHWYELTLKKPASEYILLYNVGDKWKTVDWNRKNDDQN